LSPTGQKSIVWITRESKFISVVISALTVTGPTIGASADSRGSDRDTATANGETSADEVAGTRVLPAPRTARRRQGLHHRQKGENREPRDGGDDHRGRVRFACRAVTQERRVIRETEPLPPLSGDDQPVCLARHGSPAQTSSNTPSIKKRRIWERVRASSRGSS